MSPDNRMGWIRNLEEIWRAKKKYFVDFEIQSEKHLSGILKYRRGHILCGPIVEDVPNDGLFRYQLRIQFRETHLKDKKDRIEPTKNGYYFLDGIGGEMAVLFSLYYRSRFYIVHSTYGELTHRSLPARTKWKYVYKKVNKKRNPYLFVHGRLHAFPIFLDKLKKLPEEYHHAFIKAANNYSEALKYLSIDEEIAYIKLVSAVEVLAKARFAVLPENQDVKNIQKVYDAIDKEVKKTSDRNDLKNLLNVRFSKRRFLLFVNMYSKGYFKGGRINSRLRLTRKNLDKSLNNIYLNRSIYLHEGENMYISKKFPGSNDKSDFDGSLSMNIDNRKFVKQLPLPESFEKLVRHCLLKFLDHETK